MPFDYFKIQLEEHDSLSLLQNNALLFSSSVDRNSGEIIKVNKKGKPCIPYQIAHYKGLTFKIFDSGSVYVSGSFHVYFNDGLHNFNDFTIHNFKTVLEDLEKRFKINIRKATLRGIELGLNIAPTTETNAILRAAVLHKTNPFEWKINNDEGKYKQSQHSQYIVKFYNKALHYSSRGFDIKETLRFEIKYTKMEKLNKRGIFTLHDLLNSNLEDHKRELLKEFDSIVFLDPTIKADTINTIQLLNPNHWEELVSLENKEPFKYARKKIRQLNSDSSGNYHSKTRILLEDKFNLMTKEIPQIDTLCIRSIQGKDTRSLCPITGYNISLQKQDSKLLSHTGIRFYKQHHFAMYEELKKRFLSNKWTRESEEIQIREIAHNIRNKYYNNPTNPNQKVLEFA